MNDIWRQIYKKDDAKKATTYIIVLLMTFSCQWQRCHSNMKRQMLTKKKSSIKSELTFPFIDTLPYTITSYNFDWKLSIFYGFFFLPEGSKCIYSWYNLENLDYNFIECIYHKFWKLNESRSTINISQPTKYCYLFDTIFKTISNNFLLVTIKIELWQPYRFRGSNKTATRLMKCNKIL